METQKGPIKTPVLLKGYYMGFHVSLGGCRIQGLRLEGWVSGLLGGSGGLRNWVANGDNWGYYMGYRGY